MPAFPINYARNCHPTGKIRFIEKRLWWRKRVVVLQIEESWESQTREAPAIYPLPEDRWVTFTRWRDAEALDLSSKFLCWLFDRKDA